MGARPAASGESAETQRRMKQGVTFDTGVLIAIERRKQRALQVHERLGERGIDINVPWAVVAEWWRARTDVRQNILRSVSVEIPTVALAKLAGLALAKVRRASTIDAIVMASAAMRGDVVYTTDLADLEKLREFFPSVRVLGV
jgi:predicted nucleic acid-binding protein